MKKVNLERQKLIALSQALKDEVENNPELIDLVGLGVNELLMLRYKKDTSAKHFKTFNEWKSEGFIVNKGESAYRVWGKPLKAKSKKEDAQPEEEQAQYKLWPMCCLFNETQISKLPDQSESSIGGTDGLNPFVCENYEDKQAARKDRLIERAEKKAAQSDELWQKGRSYVEDIPFGQPILVGHHSERHHRKAIERSQAAASKSVALSNEADKLERRAASVGRHGIQSDDPKAIEKLKGKLKALEKSQETMKQANKALRNGDDEALQNLGLNAAQIQEIKKPDFAGRVGFAPYVLSNNNAEIRRTQKRIAELEALRGKAPLSYTCNDYKIYIDDGRVHIHFEEGKPSAAVRQLLSKTYSFKFSRYSGTWVRKATANSVAIASRVINALQSMAAIYEPA